MGLHTAEYRSQRVHGGRYVPLFDNRPPPSEPERREPKYSDYPLRALGDDKLPIYKGGRGQRDMHSGYSSRNCPLQGGLQGEGVLVFEA